MQVRIFLLYNMQVLLKKKIKFGTLVHNFGKKKIWYIILVFWHRILVLWHRILVIWYNFWVLIPNINFFFKNQNLGFWYIWAFGTFGLSAGAVGERVVESALFQPHHRCSSPYLSVCLLYVVCLSHPY